MIKLTLTVTLATMLSGCMYQSVNSFDIKKATKICKSVNNVEYLISFFDGTEKVMCSDGVYYSLDRIDVSE